MVNLKCDETCKGGDNCTNSRIYISGLPKGCTADDITDMFGGLGTIARERPQGRGVFPDMMPYRVKFYGNDDCLLHYEDPHAAHAAPSFFDGQELKGSKLHVEMAEKKPNQGLPAGYYIPPEAKGQSYGGGGGAPTRRRWWRAPAVNGAGARRRAAVACAGGARPLFCARRRALLVQFCRRRLLRGVEAGDRAGRDGGVGREGGGAEERRR